MKTRRFAPILLLASVLWAGATLAEPPVSLPLTEAQVQCEQDQLRRLARRMAFVGAADSNLLVWRSSPGGGEYGGLVSSPIPLRRRREMFSRAESQMSFDLHLRVDGDRLDPSRPLLPQAQLVRRDAASNVLYSRPQPPFYPFPLVLLVDVAPQVVDAFEPILPLVLTTEPAKGHAERAGRGIEVDDLTSACHGEVTEFDRLVFTLVSRSLRYSTCLFPPSFDCLGNTFSDHGFIMRAPEPRHYWVDLLEYGLLCSPPDSENCEYFSRPLLTLELAFASDGNGRFTTGTIRQLPECESGQTVGCSAVACPPAGIFILPPLTPGRDQQDQTAFDRGVFLRCDRTDPNNTVLSATIDWADLLRDTAWNGVP